MMQLPLLRSMYHKIVSEYDELTTYSFCTFGHHVVVFV